MNGNDLNTQETKTETTMELARLVMLQLLSDGVITEGEYFKIRDKLIDELHPSVGELERGLPWLIDE